MNKPINVIEMFIILGFIVSFIISTASAVSLDYFPKRLKEFLVVYSVWIIVMYLMTKIFTPLWN